MLWNAEQRLIRWIVPRLPSRLRSTHLTLASLPISGMIVLASFLAHDHVEWLWAVSACIVLQWFTDSLDGALGRFRQEGLFRWGYYMDHFLDYVFLCAVLIGYALLMPARFHLLQFFVLAVFAGFMVNSYLAVTAADEFRISHAGIGPTEIRCIFILINTLLIFFGKTYLATSLPYVLALSALGLVYAVWRTQKIIWKMDMDRRNTLNKVE